MEHLIGAALFLCPCTYSLCLVRLLTRLCGPEVDQAIIRSTDNEVACLREAGSDLSVRVVQALVLALQSVACKRKTFP